MGSNATVLMATQDIGVKKTLMSVPITHVKMEAPVM